MPLPVEPDGPGWRIIAGVAYGLLFGLVGWIFKGLREEQKQQGERIGKLESSLPIYVTHDQLDKHIERLELASRRMHEDNKAALERIELKVERGSQTRHDILDGVGAIQLMLRAALEKMKKGED